MDERLQERWGAWRLNRRPRRGGQHLSHSDSDADSVHLVFHQNFISHFKARGPHGQVRMSTTSRHRKQRNQMPLVTLFDYPDHSVRAFQYSWQLIDIPAGPARVQMLRDILTWPPDPTCPEKGFRHRPSILRAQFLERWGLRIILACEGTLSSHESPRLHSWREHHVVCRLGLMWSVERSAFSLDLTRSHGLQDWACLSLRRPNVPSDPTSSG